LPAKAGIHITGPVSMAPTGAFKVLLCFSPFHLVAKAEAKDPTYKLTGLGLWSVKGLDVGQSQILARLMELDPVFQMC
jgi:hypothetical protein